MPQQVQEFLNYSSTLQITTYSQFDYAGVLCSRNALVDINNRPIINPAYIVLCKNHGLTQTMTAELWIAEESEWVHAIGRRVTVSTFFVRSLSCTR